MYIYAEVSCKGFSDNNHLIYIKQII